MNLPFQESWLLDIGLVILVIIFVFFILFLLRAVINLFRSKNKEKGAQEGCFGCLFKFLFFIALFWFSIALIALAAFIQSFQGFTKQKHIADITCETVEHENHTMRFIINQKYGAYTGIPMQFDLQGDRWFIEGDILKWNEWVNFFGLHAMYRLRRVGGVYSRTEDELKKPRTLYNLSEDKIPPQWVWFYKLGSSMPLVQDVYGISLSKPPEPNKRVKLYVTTSGFSTETLELEKEENDE